MSLPLARLAAHLFNTPLLVMPDTAVAIAAALHERFDVAALDGADAAGVIEASRFRGRAAENDSGRALYRVENGVAVIPVLGELVNRGAWIGAISGLCSYEGLDAQIAAAAADPAVQGLVLDMNTPGGEASGCMEIAERLQALDKPVVAFVNAQACSAGYAIACGADAIVATPTALLGSIGVVMLHLDRSAALAKSGVKPTLIHAGAHKVDGTSLQALPDDARQRIQAKIDGLYDLFVATVAAARGLDADAVRATEGGVLMGQAAVAAGLADRLGTLDDALALARPKLPKLGALLMSDTIARADHEAALKAAAESQAAALAKAGTDAAAAATAAAHARSQAILGSEAAKGREDQARAFAFETDISADAAIALLAKAPAAAAPAAKSRLTVENPDLAPDGGGDANALGAGFTPWAKVVEEAKR